MKPPFTLPLTTAISRIGDCVLVSVADDAEFINLVRNERALKILMLPARKIKLAARRGEKMTTFYQ